MLRAARAASLCARRAAMAARMQNRCALSAQHCIATSNAAATGLRHIGAMFGIDKFPLLVALPIVVGASLLELSLRCVRCLRALLGTLLMPPGWQADRPGETAQELRRHAQTLT